MRLLETDRLILRAWQESDFDDFFEYASDPNVGTNVGWEPHTDKEVSLEHFRSFLGNDLVWAVVLKENNKAVGSISLQYDEKRPVPNILMLGYILSPDYWGQGIMTEAAKRVIRFAFEEQNLVMLTTYHFPLNKRSKQVIEKCGFKYEGILRNSTKIYDGTILDEMCYSMSRSEYLFKR